MDARRPLARALLALVLLVPGAGLAEGAPERAPAEYCAVADVPTPHTSGDAYLYAVLDWTYALPADFEPPDLVPVSLAGFAGAGSGGLVREIVIADLAALHTAAVAAGHRLVIRSAYRSFQTQELTFRHWVEEASMEEALRVSARPGHSEHQLGTAIDIGSDALPPWEYEDWAETPAGAWTVDNAWRYGFVMSYPPDGEDRTCYGYEPWHYRWVGRETAGLLRESGLTLREYLECCAGFRAQALAETARWDVYRDRPAAHEVRVRNTGTVTWDREDPAMRVELALAAGLRVPEAMAASWLGPDRIATTVEARVPPGAVGRFRFAVWDPGFAGRYWLALRLVNGRDGWLEGTTPVLVTSHLRPPSFETHRLVALSVSR